jgi:hypothetical protein
MFVRADRAIIGERCPPCVADLLTRLAPLAISLALFPADG